jgi:hypothetical protein
VKASGQMASITRVDASQMRQLPPQLRAPSRTSSKRQKPCSSLRQEECGYDLDRMIFLFRHVIRECCGVDERGAVSGTRCLPCGVEGMPTKAGAAS